MLRQGTIEELKSTISEGRGLARTNLYYVFLPSLDGRTSTYDKGLLCSSVTLPSKQLTTVERTIGVDQQNVVHGYVNPNVTMSFRVLNDQGVREYFDKWQTKALRQYGTEEGRFEANYPDNYTAPIQIFQLEKGISFPVLNVQKDLGVFRRPLGAINVELDIDVATAMQSNYRWILNRAYPVSVTNETLTDNGQNEISEIQVEFAYLNWNSEKLEPKNNDKNELAKLAGILSANI
jgi:hypothetical protein